MSENNNLVEQFISIENDLVWRLTSDNFGVKFDEHNVSYIYNPLNYAANLHRQYLDKYCTTFKKVLFLGMNPGPFGMCQTGIPFGEIAAVKDFLKIQGDVLQPEKYHHSRPILGLNCKRSEVSGRRLWDLIKYLSDDDPNNFFKNCIVHNYFPLALLSETGKNITPEDLKTAERKLLNSICDEFLYKILKLLKVEVVVAIGKYAEKRTRETLQTYEDKTIKVVVIPHPSPRSKQSNINWKENIISCFGANDIMKYFQH